MFDPLMLSAHCHIQVEIYDGVEPERFICTKIDTLNEDSSPSLTRYQLQSIQSARYICLDVTKDKNNDFQFIAYELVEKMIFSFSFMSMLGTKNLGYTHANLTNDIPIIYEYFPEKSEKIKIIKYIADIEDLESSPENYGYTQDANGQWYCLVSISDGNIKKFSDNHIRRSWEYQAKDDTRLLIEINESSTIKNRNIYIYQGTKLQRKAIRLLHAAQKSEHNLLHHLLAQPQKLHHTIPSV